jgi:hypothetical protein
MHVCIYIPTAPAEQTGRPGCATNHSPENKKSPENTHALAARAYIAAGQQQASLPGQRIEVLLRVCKPADA